MIHRLPKLVDPEKYGGLYIFDFGDHVAVGYTAEEIEFILAEPAYSGGTVYKICRASPDGTLEIRGVDPLNWGQSTGRAFWFADEVEAVRAYEKLMGYAEAILPPGEFNLVLVRQGGGSEVPFAMVMRYVQELDEAVSSWLLKVGFEEGRHVEGGPKVVTGALTNGTELRRTQLGADGFKRPRSRREVLDAVDQPVQR